MIVSDRGFLIATPTKCATTTLEVIAKRNMRRPARFVGQFRVMDWESPRRQHRMALPPPEWVGTRDNEWGDADRFMMVRNPYARLVSLYDYMRAPRNYSQWGARVVCGSEWSAPAYLRRNVREGDPYTFEEFLLWLADERVRHGRLAKRRGDITEGRAYRSPWVWSDSLLTSWRLLLAQPGEGAVAALKMERLPSVLAWFCEVYGVQMSQRMVHSNKNVMRPSGPPRGYWHSIDCTRRLYTKRGEFRADEVRATAGCACAACTIGVAEEAEFFGYGGVGTSVGWDDRADA